jgi:ABC-type uncharacterized transport system fused permease/ATPase subunit
VVPSVFAQERAEGYFRFSQARIRTYVESIAFYNGEDDEKKHSNDRFKNVLVQTVKVLKTQFWLNCIYNYISY